ncbi:alpha/beta hydrolase [Alteromonas aestuariivivens]|uniref:Alpha/beta hydrolase n=1 Tax=Alteromonas aestuariivivens TaxID=1938339 RepID=A0A3D8M3A4_9ALTE|nr:alpha/beta hydrolase [Alteromonas aestuariivivens]RDV24121.1 alpha/beta hydrolase [Alteromonas aestuariivivens]
MWILITFITLLVAIYLYTYPAAGHLLVKTIQQCRMIRYDFRERGYRVNGIPIIVLENASHQVHDNRPLMIMLHDIASDKNVWLPLAIRLRERFHVVIPDLPGHGETGFTQQWDYTIKTQSQRLVALIWQLGYQQAHIVGNGMGADMAIYMAVYHASAVSSIVLMSPLGLETDALGTDLNRFMKVSSPKHYYRLYNTLMARPPWTPTIIKDAQAAEFIDNRLKMERICQDLQSSRSLISESQLAQLAPAVFILWGGQNKLVNYALAERWKDLTGAEIQVFHDLGHRLMVESPARTAYALCHFYSRINGFESIKMPARLEDFYKNLPL